MRRRMVKELGTALGVVVILAVLVFGNLQVKRGGLREEMEAKRAVAEGVQKKSGLSLLSWSLLQKTRGSAKSGPFFDAELKKFGSQPVNLVGFMAPIDEFKDASYFMLLPVPIGCFFCEAPPLRDVILVEMEEGRKATMVEEPIIVSGTLVLNEAPGSQFFYGIKNANWGSATQEGTLTRKEISIEHQTHMTRGADEMKSGQQQLFEAEGGPQTADGNVPAAPVD